MDIKNILSKVALFVLKCMTLSLIPLNITYSVMNNFFEKFNMKTPIISTNELTQLISKNMVERIDIDDDNKISHIMLQNTTTFKIKYGFLKNFLSQIENSSNDNNIVPIEYIDSVNYLEKTYNILFYIVAILFLGTALFLFVKSKLTKNNDTDDEQNISSLFNITGMVNIQEIEPVSCINVKFDDVIGVEPAKNELKEYINFITNRQIYVDSGYTIPKGLLFTGLPGTGKTMLAKAYANECNSTFYAICGSDFLDPFVGVGSKKIKKLFETAKQQTSAVIFIDEIDAIGVNRRETTRRGNGSDTILNTLLTEMDGFKDNTNIMIIAATNRVELLDPALVRSGRFDKEIIFDRPNVKEREKMFDLYMSKIKLHNNIRKFTFQQKYEDEKQEIAVKTIDKVVDGTPTDQQNNFMNNILHDLMENLNPEFTKITQIMAKKTAGMTGADIKNICNQSVYKWMSTFTMDKKTQISKIKNIKLEEALKRLSNSVNKLIDVDNIRDIKIITLDKQSKNEKSEEDAENAEDAKDAKDAKDVKDEDKENKITDEEQKLYDDFEYDGVTEDHLIKSIDDIIIGVEKRERQQKMTEDDIKCTAIHEAGHALVGYILKSTSPPIKVSIIPRGRNALGFTQHEPDEKQTYTTSHIMDRIGVLIAGRVAEEVAYGESSTGCSDDMEKIDSLINMLIEKYGVKKLNYNMHPTDKQRNEFIGELMCYVISTITTMITNRKIELLEIANLLEKNEEIFYDDIENSLKHVDKKESLNINF